LCLALYLLAHRISKDVLRLVTGFDAAVITLSSAIRLFASVHELITNYSVANKLHPTIDTFFFATRSILIIIGHFSVSVMDLWMVSTKGKLNVPLFEAPFISNIRAKEQPSFLERVLL